MRRVRIPVALSALAGLVLLPGCLTLYSKTEVIRGDEARRPVRFESPQAADAFQEAVKKQNASVGGTHVGVPFITLIAKDKQLSESAVWNDAVAKCDTDQDGLITYIEAAIFSKSGP